MAEDASIADDTGTMGLAVLATAKDIAQVAATLRGEVEQFLTTMSQDESFRRRYERIPGKGASAILHIGNQQIPAIVENISRGGAGLACSFQAEPGIDVKVSLPGSTAPVSGR